MRRIIILIAAVLMSACATRQPIRSPLSEAQRATTPNVSVKNIIVQDEIILDVQASNVGVAMGGGLLGAMIDSAVTTNRQQDAYSAAERIYPATENIDFRAILSEAVTRRFQDKPFGRTRVSTTARGLSTRTLNLEKSTLAQDEMLWTLVTTYKFGVDFKSIVVTLVSAMWAKSEPRLIYRSEFWYQSKAVGQGGEDSTRLWAADNGALVRSELQQAATDLSRMVREDLDQNSPIKNAAPTVQQFPLFALITPRATQTLQGRLIEEQNGRRWVLGIDEVVYSVPQGE